MYLMYVMLVTYYFLLYLVLLYFDYFGTWSYFTCLTIYNFIRMMSNIRVLFFIASAYYDCTFVFVYCVYTEAVYLRFFPTLNINI